METLSHLFSITASISYVKCLLCPWMYSMLIYMYQPLRCCYNHYGVVGMKYVHGYTGPGLSWHEKSDDKKGICREAELLIQFETAVCSNNHMRWIPLSGHAHVCLPVCLCIQYCSVPT